jgi:hypothetical protein
MDEPVYVADLQTHEVLYANQALKDALGLDLVGGVCYQALHGLEAPCSFCTDWRRERVRVGRSGDRDHRNRPSAPPGTR